MSIPKAHASQAASVSENLDFVRQVVAEVAPVVTSISVDNETASLSHAPDGYLSKPLLAETKITLESKPISLKKLSKNFSPAVTKGAGDFKGNSFPFGYCTYYVAKKRLIPWRGNAITWLSGARSYGFATGNIPQVGAIVVTAEGGAAGHVAYIDAVNDGTITISEMNYAGFGRISSRTISVSYGAIKGYIY